MKKKNAQQWSFIFDVLGEENLRKLLFRAAMKKDEEGRVIVEFDGTTAMEITDHVDELEGETVRQETGRQS
jgi:hypothetical protein